MSYLANKSEVREFSLPLQIAIILFGLAFLVFASRLWYLQLLRGEQFRLIARDLALLKRPIPAPRGMIFDTTGRRLADNRASYDLRITPIDVTDKEKLFARLSELVDMTPEEISAKFEEVKSYSNYQPGLIESDLSWPEVAAVRTFLTDLPGVELDIGSKRTYLYGALFAHQIGYLGEVTKEELPGLQKKHGEDYYVLGHMKGKSGVEAKYELELKGRDGRRIAAKDRLGREVSLTDAGRLLDDLLNLTNAAQHVVPGNNLRLSIDLGLQQHIAKAFGQQSGAVVVMDVRTGLIRAMFNNPAYDPEIFARGISHVEWEALRDHPDHPLEDKSIRGIYAPGSTYKLFTAAAGLGTNTINERTTFTCTGSFRFGNRTFNCWQKKGHGVVDLKKAIQYSCDVYFYNTGVKVGVDRLAEYAKSFGLGVRPGLGLNDEKEGLIPTTEWKRMVQRQEWYEGETVSIAIGQGQDLITPLQLAVSYGAIATGNVMQPQIVEQITAPDGKVVHEFQPIVKRKPKITPEHLALLQKGLYAVVNEGGTGARSRIEEVHMAGKTGTAQVISYNTREDKVLDKHLRDHALFAAYAPYESPEIAIAVIVENGEHGSSTAAPIAKAVVEYWFRDQIAAKRAGKEPKKIAAVGATPAATPAAEGTATGEPAPTFTPGPMEE